MRPDINDRIRRANRNNEERKAQEQVRIQTALAERREREELLKWKEYMQFEIALLALQIVRFAEECRDENSPSSPDEPWNNAFCESVRMLPEAAEFAKDCLADCIKWKG